MKIHKSRYRGNVHGMSNSLDIFNLTELEKTAIPILKRLAEIFNLQFSFWWTGATQEVTSVNIYRETQGYSTKTLYRKKEDFLASFNEFNISIENNELVINKELLNTDTFVRFIVGLLVEELL